MVDQNMCAGQNRAQCIVFVWLILVDEMSCYLSQVTKHEHVSVMVGNKVHAALVSLT